ncbi:dynactin Arp1 p62 subunit RO2 [Aspergillus heteromorphus CBS 117.55]|uniref:Dynactin subunit 4 n=1 Tax=Aspergillus heteromorphus CBS 117.55 TaxID=1448321 RepID=A0A317X6F5_9EURO|nr:dynactin Arp1 p62 subunit RO2 [Aspergillus heteromorphus CBS 117.55]PWY92478.1 dynactin Arp1 p62 subunit RO2 [Aspergillus heteromorphus CBS 117.55]
MSRPFPYTYISCPCANTPVPDPSKKRRSRESPQKSNPDQPKPLVPIDDEDEAFDPRSPRANFSLYPPEQLLYCEDCHQIKCPRCITEEIVCWYCPNCLFETPSSMVRSEGNRCARNCFNCPSCTAPLSVSTLENVVVGGTSQQGPWVLSCGYCMWSTLDIGIKFDKPTNIRTQLSKLTEATPVRSRQMSRTFGELKSPLSTYSSIDEHFPPPGETNTKPEDSPEQPTIPLNSDARFNALKNFYKTQISATSSSPTDPLGMDFGAGFSSPGALNRIMSLYTSSSRLSSLYGGANKKPKTRPPVMREALTASEGLKIPAPDAEEALIQRIAGPDCGWDGLASLEQRSFQSPDARFVEDLLPLPVLLRTKRSKRCKSCKHILVKPELKPQSTRFRIRLIALSYIPLPTLRPLNPGPHAAAVLPTPAGSTAPTTSTSTTLTNLDALSPLRPIQLLLTLKNHMFDPVRVTLATPSVTPGRVASKVTILCPQFDIGANSDVWDEALQGAAAATPAPGTATATATATTTPSTDPRGSRSGGLGVYEKVAEAGKVWDKGRNWTTVVLEVVPGTLPGGVRPSKTKKYPVHDNEPDTTTTNTNKNNNNNKKKAHNASDSDNDDDEDDNDSDSSADLPALDWTGQADDPGQKLQPDEDVLEIPVFVHMEWDSENQIDNEQAVGRSSGDTVKRELAYWMVLGVGRIVQ